MTQPDDVVLVPPFVPNADASNVDTTGLDDAASRRERLAAQIDAIAAVPEGPATPEEPASTEETP